MVAFGRTALKSKGGRFLCPIAAPIENVVVWKVMPGGLSLHRHGFEVRVVPNQRPEIFRINLVESLQPYGHALRLAALEALSQAIEQIVVGMKMPLRMSARILFAFACAR